MILKNSCQVIRLWLAKSGPSDDCTHVSTRVVGTCGYAAPGYIVTVADELRLGNKFVFVLCARRPISGITIGYLTAWTIMAMAIFGFNEFMMLLKNPLLVLGLFVAYLIGKALWVQLDVAGEFRHGTAATFPTIAVIFPQPYQH
ncbi:hypothetical protein P8452_26906 [Trifolium repens]|nr:hypothetical protein P8452_26906 [Trifolium repens]